MARGPQGPPPPQQESIPWRQAKTKDGKTYYYHPVTKEVAWDDPEKGGKIHKPPGADLVQGQFLLQLPSSQEALALVPLQNAPTSPVVRPDSSLDWPSTSLRWKASRAFPPVRARASQPEYPSDALLFPDASPPPRQTVLPATSTRLALASCS